MSAATDTVVFLGPSLDRATAASVLPDALFLPPIKRHDLKRVLQEVGPAYIGIVDGEFYQSLAVSPKEVVVALREGCRVYGASSMGALRAAETWSLGMVGVGRIFEMYRNGVIVADDEVALMYCPETYRAHSDPLVCLRIALCAAVREGVAPRRDARRLLARMRKLYFPERTMRRLLAESRRMMPSAEAMRFEEFMREHPDQKRVDALAMLERMGEDRKRRLIEPA